MKRTIITRMGPVSLFTFVAVLLVCLAACSSESARRLELSVGPPPATRTVDVVDTLHGTPVPDPYRWLEDQQAPETRTWIDAQNTYTDSIMKQLPDQEALRQSLTRLMKIDTISVPVERNGRYFFYKRQADQDLSVIYMRQGIDGPDQVVIDPHPLSADHTTSVGMGDISDDGRYMIYMVRQGGVDEIEIRLRDVDTGKDLPDVLPTARYFGVTLTPDNKTLIYTRYTREGARIYTHRLGTDPASDRMIFGDGYPPDQLGFANLSPDGKWLLVTVAKGTSGHTELYLQNFAANGPWKTVIKDGVSRSMADFAGDKLMITTDLDAPNRRVMLADLTRPEVANWTQLIPEDKDAVLQGAMAMGGKAVAYYLRNVKDEGRIYDLDGRLVREITFDTMGSIGGSNGRWNSNEAFFSFSTFHVPPTIYHYDLNTGQKTVWARIDVPVDSNSMELKQVWTTSKDGTRVPMFVLHRKGITLDGTTPTVIYGYGGFNASRTPAFSSRAVAWVQSGGIYCVANLRGGGEFGEAWHQAGMMEKKQNVFDDLYGCAQWLFDNHYTSPRHLGIMGGSNGGLLVGAAMTQHPEMFGAVICSYPLLDMIRYHQFLVGRFWVSEYGSSDNPDQFKYLLDYSPYHNVRPGVTYPATLFITGDGDSRVAPLHARKMAARVQAANGGDAPVMLRYHTKAGHSGGQPVSEQIDDMVEIMSFLKWRLGA